MDDERYAAEYVKVKRKYGNLPRSLDLRLWGDSYRVLINWYNLTNAVRLAVPKSGPLLGGLKTHWSHQSFAAFGETDDLIVINLGMFLVRLAWWTMSWFESRPRALRRVAGFLLAHECRHLMQGTTGYGRFDSLIRWTSKASFWLWLVGLPTVLLGQVGIWVLVLAGLLFLPYFMHWKEVDANWYAIRHWQYWSQFVTVTQEGMKEA